MKVKLHKRRSAQCRSVTRSVYYSRACACVCVRWTTVQCRKLTRRSKRNLVSCRRLYGDEKLRYLLNYVVCAQSDNLPLTPSLIGSNTTSPGSLNNTISLVPFASLYAVQWMNHALKTHSDLDLRFWTLWVDILLLTQTSHTHMESPLQLSDIHVVW